MVAIWKGFKHRKTEDRTRHSTSLLPSAFCVLTTFVEFHYRALEPEQLEPKGLRGAFGTQQLWSAKNFLLV